MQLDEAIIMEHFDLSYIEPEETSGKPCANAAPAKQSVGVVLRDAGQAASHVMSAMGAWCSRAWLALPRSIERLPELVGVDSVNPLCPLPSGDSDSPCMVLDESSDEVPELGEPVPVLDRGISFVGRSRARLIRAVRTLVSVVDDVNPLCPIVPAPTTAPVLKPRGFIKDEHYESSKALQTIIYGDDLITGPAGEELEVEALLAKLHCQSIEHCWQELRPEAIYGKEIEARYAVCSASCISMARNFLLVDEESLDFAIALPEFLVPWQRAQSQCPYDTNLTPKLRTVGLNMPCVIRSLSLLELNDRAMEASAQFWIITQPRHVAVMNTPTIAWLCISIDEVREMLTQLGDAITFIGVMNSGGASVFHVHSFSVVENNRLHYAVEPKSLLLVAHHGGDKALAENWNRIMHALNGNTDRCDFEGCGRKGVWTGELPGKRCTRHLQNGDKRTVISSHHRQCWCGIIASYARPDEVGRLRCKAHRLEGDVNKTGRKKPPAPDAMLIEETSETSDEEPQASTTNATPQVHTVDIALGTIISTSMDKRMKSLSCAFTHSKLVPTEARGKVIIENAPQKTTTKGVVETASRWYMQSQAHFAIAVAAWQAEAARQALITRLELSRVIFAYVPQDLDAVQCRCSFLFYHFTVMSAPTEYPDVEVRQGWRLFQHPDPMYHGLTNFQQLCLAYCCSPGIGLKLAALPRPFGVVEAVVMIYEAFNKYQKYEPLFQHTVVCLSDWPLLCAKLNEPANNCCAGLPVTIYLGADHGGCAFHGHLSWTRTGVRRLQVDPTTVFPLRYICTDTQMLAALRLLRDRLQLRDN